MSSFKLTKQASKIVADTAFNSFYLVSQVFSFKLTKQTSKIVADTTFKNSDTNLRDKAKLYNDVHK